MGRVAAATRIGGRTAVVAALFALLWSCGGATPEDEALDLVGEACGTGRPVAPGDGAGETVPTEILADYDEALALASEAASKDQRWDELQAAYSTLRDAWSAVVDVLGARADDGNLNDLDAATTARLRALAPTLLDDATEAERTIRAECRKIDAASSSSDG